MIPQIINLRLYGCNVTRYRTQLIIGRRWLSTSELKKYYALLNVTQNSTLKEIKDSFLKLSKIYHPDNKVTGSHTKFVELKQAYDAVKDGPPTITSSFSPRSAANNNSYSNYDEHADLSYRSYARRQDAYKMGYSSSFGGPYGRSRTPWEDLARDREYERIKYQRTKFGTRRGPLVNITLFFSALAWIVIYSCVILLWDYDDYTAKREIEYGNQNYLNYLTMEDNRRRREALLRESQKNNADTINNTNNVSQDKNDIKEATTREVRYEFVTNEPTANVPPTS